jgi:hypothetical protein
LLLQTIKKKQQEKVRCCNFVPFLVQDQDQDVGSERACNFVSSSFPTMLHCEGLIDFFKVMLHKALLVGHFSQGASALFQFAAPREKCS